MSDNAPRGFDRERGPGGLELRSLPFGVAKLEARSAGDTTAPMIAGYGSVTDQATRISGHYETWDEVVAPGAWAASIADGDVRAMFNHDTNLLLGRTKPGTLRLGEDDYGLQYSIDVNPDDPSAMSTHAKVKRGDVDGSSVWFRVVAEEWTYPDDMNGLEYPLRRILEGALMEVGPVTFPAFEATTSQARSLAPLDAALRSAGVREAKRAGLIADLLADSSEAQTELSVLLAGNHELREAVCSCEHPAPVHVTAQGQVLTEQQLTSLVVKGINEAQRRSPHPVTADRNLISAIIEGLNETPTRSAWQRSAAMRLELLSKSRVA